MLRVKALLKIVEILQEFDKLKKAATKEQDVEDLENLESIFVGTKETLEKKL